MAGKFSMDIQKDKKVFRVFAEGFFTMEDGMAFSKDFISKSKGLEDYDLFIDCAGVKPSSQEVAEALGKAIELYVKTPFKNRYVMKQSSVVGHNQTRRLIRQIAQDFGVNEDIITFVQSSNEVYK